MRLSEAEKAAIKNIFNKYSDAGVQLYLFGSRVDDSKKGGDIDLLITFIDAKRVVLFKKLDFLVALKKALGERKIDITLAAVAEIQHDVFLQLIMQSAVELTD